MTLVDRLTLCARALVESSGAGGIDDTTLRTAVAEILERKEVPRAATEGLITHREAANLFLAHFETWLGAREPSRLLALSTLRPASGANREASAGSLRAERAVRVALFPDDVSAYWERLGGTEANLVDGRAIGTLRIDRMNLEFLFGPPDAPCDWRFRLPDGQRVHLKLDEAAGVATVHAEPADVGRALRGLGLERRLAE